MGETVQDNLRFDVPDNTLDDNTWGVILNTLISEMELAITGIHNQAFGASDITIVFTGGVEDEARRAILNGTGPLSGNVNFIVPNEPKIYIVANNTTEAFTLGIKTAAGTRLDIPQGEAFLVWCDGADGFFTIKAAISGIAPTATTSLQLGGTVAANFAQKAIKNQWTKPQIVDATQAVLTLADPKTFEANADNDTTIFVSAAEMARDTNDLKFLNPIGTPIDGQSLIFIVEQKTASPVLSLTWDTEFLFPDDTDINITQTVNKVDSFAFLYSNNLAAWINFGTSLNIPRSSP